MSGYAYASDRPTVLVDPTGAAPTNGSPQAHDTAIALRVLDLEAEFNGMVWVNTAIGGLAGADLVCWNCGAWFTDGKNQEVWVWEFKSVQDSPVDASASLARGLAAAHQDPLARNGMAGYLNVVPGRAFPNETGGMVVGIPNQTIIVYSDPTRDRRYNGVELYEAWDNGTPLFSNDPRRLKSDQAVDMAAYQNARANRARANLYTNAATPDEVTTWGISLLIGALVAPFIVAAGEAIAGAIFGGGTAAGGAGGAGATGAAGTAAKKACELVRVC